MGRGYSAFVAEGLAIEATPIVERASPAIEEAPFDEEADTRAEFVVNLQGDDLREQTKDQATSEPSEIQLRVSSKHRYL